MVMKYTEILEVVRQYIEEFYLTKEDSTLTFHNFAHTHDVVEHAMKMAVHYGLDERETFVVTAASWFHDTGYCTGGAVGHEERGAEIAGKFLKNLGVAQELIGEVQKCIMATVMPQQPENLLEQILCDADLYHFGTEQFSERNMLMQREVEKKTGCKIDSKNWRQATICLLESHFFKTGYGRELLEYGKRKNLERLKRKESRARLSKSPVTNAYQGD
jgi:predicted metal-dependent HD superfamily phosphohydrolase